MSKELIHAAANFYLTSRDSVGDGPFSPMVELALVTSEPVYRYDEGGSFTRTRVMETVRVHASAGTLRAIAETFGKWADEAEAMGAELVERHISGLEEVAEDGDPAPPKKKPAAPPPNPEG